MYLNSAEFRKQAEIFTSKNCNHDCVRDAGLKAVSILYGAKHEEMMADLRARIMGSQAKRGNCKDNYYPGNCMDDISLQLQLYYPCNCMDNGLSLQLR